MTRAVRTPLKKTESEKKTRMLREWTYGVSEPIFICVKIAERLSSDIEKRKGERYRSSREKDMTDAVEVLCSLFMRILEI